MTYFEDLPQSTKDIIKNTLLDISYLIGPDGLNHPKDCIDDIECYSREGFIPFSSNKGGYTYRNFVTLMDYWGNGHKVAHKKASKEIERQIDYSLEWVSESLKEIISNEDYKYYFGNKDFKNTLTYSNLSNLINTLKKQKQNTKLLESWLNKIQDFEYDYLSDDNRTIMHELRVLYHGKEGRMHKASISAAINTEASFHAFCEGSKEVEITWTNNKELKEKLTYTLGQLIKEIF